MTAALELAGLGKDYGDATAVHGVDLVVDAGQIVGLLGPNGAGKTTTISMVAGVITPTRGTARVLGHDIAVDASAARRALGLVPQDLALYEDLSARENLRFFGSLYGLTGRALASRVDWALRLAQLVDRAGDRVSTYSGGMKRRLNLAAGLLHEPSLVVLDEPTVGVDPQSRAHIFDTVRALRDDGMTVLYTSHYMEEVEALCDRVAIMDRGRIVAEDTVDALVAAHCSGGLTVTVEVEGSDDADGVRAALRAAGYAAADVRATAANLETVFLAVTGRALRDD